MKTVDLSKPVQLVGGGKAKVTLLSYNESYAVGYVEFGSRKDHYIWDHTGRAATTHMKVSLMNIENAPAPEFKLERWVNLYKDGDVVRDGGCLYGTSKEAAASAGPNKIACLKVTLHGLEGDGL